MFTDRNSTRKNCFFSLLLKDGQANFPGTPGLAVLAKVFDQTRLAS